jgi:hypothetical protein
MRTAHCTPDAPTPGAKSSHESTINEDNQLLICTNNEQNAIGLALLSNDPVSTLDAQIVPEQDLNIEVQQQMDALTVNALRVEVKIKDRAAQPRHAVPKSVILIIIAVCLALVAISSAFGIKNRNKRLSNTSNENESGHDESSPTSPPTFVSDMELARSIFSPLLGNEALWDESLQQYKVLWWIVHEDPAKMMMKVQDETQSLSSMIVERYVMALLYFSTDGPSWFQQWNFLGNTSICDWRVHPDNGVQCNNKGSAVQLQMSKFLLEYIVCHSFSYPHTGQAC